MSEFKPSVFQQAFFDWIQTGTGSAILKAVAGSGKTTSVVQSLNLIDYKKSIVFLAFNKSIADELANRAPDYVNCMTMNSLGHKSVMKAFGRVTLDSKKTWRIMEDMVDSGDATVEEVKYLGSYVNKLVGIAKSVGLVPATMKDKTCLVEDTLVNWEALMDHYSVEIGSDTTPPEMLLRMKHDTIDLTRKVLSASIKETRVIDFNDQLYFPVVYNLAVPQFDWVFVDEAQDISAIQRNILAKAMKKNSRLVAVGDPAQAIYGFRGADSASLANIAKDFNCIELPLSISYRCPKRVVLEAQRFVSHILPSETAPEGEVLESGEARPELFKTNDMVICRNSAPIIKLAYALIAAKTPVKVMGRDIGEGLINLIRKLKARSVMNLDEKLTAWKDREIAKLQAADPEPDLSKVEDRYECIKCFIDCSGAATVDGICQAIERLFGDKTQGVVTLATIHKAKGLEAKRVFILDSWRMPSKYAKKPHQIEQENNLFYVAITRAQQELHYVNSPKKDK